MLFFLYDFRKFFFELLIGFLKYVYDTYYEQETNYTGQIEEIIGLMVKCTPERGHNALFFIPLEVIIML